MLEVLLWGLYVRMCVSVYVYLCAPNLCVHECMCVGVYWCMYVHI
jgi:hypothetical protein